MQKINTALVIPPSTQMRAVAYRNNNLPSFLDPSLIVGAGIPLRRGLGGLGTALDTVANADPEPLTSAAIKVVSAFKKIFGLFTHDPNKDIHIPAQNAAVAGFTDVLNAYNTTKVQGRLTLAYINTAQAAIEQIYNSFAANMQGLQQRYPQYASRYAAGSSEVVALGKQIIYDNMAADRASAPSTATTAVTHISHGISSALAGLGGGSGVLPLLALGALFLLPSFLNKRG